MKVRYTFNADLDDVQEILFQKYSRAYNKSDLNELHQRLKVSCLEKKSFKEIEKVLTIYKDAVSTVLIELNEDLEFVNGLVNALEGNKPVEKQETHPVKEDNSVLTEAQKTSKTIQELTGMLSALSKNGNNHE